MHLSEMQTAGMKKRPVPLGVGGFASSPGLLLSFMTLALLCPKRDASTSHGKLEWFLWIPKGSLASHLLLSLFREPLAAS